VSLPVHLVGDLGDVAPGTVVAVEGDEAHHALAVRRMRLGEAVALTDGRGTRAVGEVAGAGKRRMEVLVSSVDRVPEPEPALVVVQALPKGDRGELAVGVLTEVGCARILPWAASRSVAVWRGERAVKSLARWRATAREAAKQARRAWFPEVSPLVTTAEAVAVVAEADLAVVLHEDAGTSLAELAVPRTGTLALVVGPEGGLAEEEVSAFRHAGAVDVRLGTEVLRTSTAGVAAAAALLSRTARW
jgi:16S rRNA (uracil1498-N3)-methyltransferase